jgi:hypothetical protein
MRKAGKQEKSDGSRAGYDFVSMISSFPAFLLSLETPAF